MKLVNRNYMWVRDYAFRIGDAKKGIAANCFTVGEVAEALGFSRTTVKKYVDMLVADQVIKPVAMSNTITIYRFTRSYLEGITGDRLSSLVGA